MIPLFKVAMSPHAAAAVNETLMSGYVTQGPKVDRFEAELADSLVFSSVIATNSCTSALDLAFELCNIGPGDEVISTAMTCFATNSGLIKRGAVIRWANINSRTGLIDAVDVANLINKKTKAIVAVDWAGKYCNYAALKSYGIPVIEDSAHVWDGERNFSVERADYICYSFQAIKFLTCGDGGALIVPADQDNRARKLRWYGLDRTKNENFRVTQNIEEAGFKYNMNDIAAAIGIVNMPFATRNVEAHLLNAEFYSNYINNINKHVSAEPFDDTMSYWIYPIHVENPEKFIKYMQEKDIQVGSVHYRNDKYGSTKQFDTRSLPGLDKFASTQVNIPCGWWLSKHNKEYILEAIVDYNA
jgi:dTDP-4-amino-4,6-dideoxygalactose transaminase